MNIYSTNEWDQLKKVVVGIADYCRIPDMDKSLRVINYADKENVNDIKTGLYPTRVVDESNEDLEKFVEFLKRESVEVVRPTKTPEVEYYNYCPRDTVFVYEDRALATPMSLRARDNEFRHMLPHIESVEISPRYKNDDLYDETCVGEIGRAHV